MSRGEKKSSSANRADDTARGMLRFNPFLKLGECPSLRVSIEIWRQDQADEFLRWLLVGVENSSRLQSLVITELPMTNAQFPVIRAPVLRTQPIGHAEKVGES